MMVQAPYRQLPGGGYEALSRDVTQEECEFLDDRWKTRHEPNAPQPNPAPVHASDTPPCPGGTVGCSPIILDLGSSGIPLTSLRDGVYFDLDSDGALDSIGWTCLENSKPFLWLDRDFDGLVDGGAELFGDSTPQPAGPTQNGFNALAVYDTVLGGGNGDGVISVADEVFGDLRLWNDTHPRNGQVDAGESLTLYAAGVTWIGLAYEDRRVFDQFGNVYRWYGHFGQAAAPMGEAIDVLFIGGPVADQGGEP